MNAAAFKWTEVDEQHLVLSMVDNFAEEVATAGEISRGELASKNGILEVIAEVAHSLETLRKRLSSQMS